MKLERERQIPHDTTYTWNPKHGTNEPIYKVEKDLHREQACGCRGGEGCGKEGVGVWG